MRVKKHTLAAAMMAAFIGNAKRVRYSPTVKSDRWGNRSKYVPAGARKNLQPHNR